MKTVWYALFWTCSIAGMACFGAHTVGQVALMRPLGAIFTVLAGLVFLLGCYMIGTAVREAWIRDQANLRLGDRTASSS